jgi:hypothetical protein
MKKIHELKIHEENTKKIHELKIHEENTFKVLVVGGTCDKI